MAAAVPKLARAIDGESVRVPRKTVVSTVTGTRLTVVADVRETLLRQLTAPVLFAAAIDEAAVGVDLWIEVGPGQVLTGLASELVSAPVMAVDAGGPSLSGLLGAVGAAFALGAPITPAPLFSSRFTRPFSLDRRLRFPDEPLRGAIRARVVAAGRHRRG